MSPDDGSMDEMRIQRDFELALAGLAPPSALTAAIDDLRGLGDACVDEETARRHIAAAAAAAREDDNVASVVLLPLGRAPRRSRTVARSVARTAIAAAACLALMVSLASADLLPNRVQSAVADIADRVGLNLPDPDNDPGGESRPEPDEADVTPPEPAPTVEPPSVPAGPPAEVPSGPPAGAPTGPPAGVPAPEIDPPAGPPPEAPGGPPAGVPSGPPAGVDGAPDGTPGP